MEEGRRGERCDCAKAPSARERQARWLRGACVRKGCETRGSEARRLGGSEQQRSLCLRHGSLRLSHRRGEQRLSGCLGSAEGVHAGCPLCALTRASPPTCAEPVLLGWACRPRSPLELPSWLLSRRAQPSLWSQGPPVCGSDLPEHLGSPKMSLKLQPVVILCIPSSRGLQ